MNHNRAHTNFSSFNTKQGKRGSLHQHGQANDLGMIRSTWTEGPATSNRPCPRESRTSSAGDTLISPIRRVDGKPTADIQPREFDRNCTDTVDLNLLSRTGTGGMSHMNEATRLANPFNRITERCWPWYGLCEVLTLQNAIMQHRRPENLGEPLIGKSPAVSAEGIEE